MKAESVVLAVAGAFFGLIVGWILGSQQASPGRVAPAPAAQVQAQQGAVTAAPPKTLDENQVRTLREAAAREPGNARPRVELANLYFDAERYDDAITWYQEALKLSPKDPNVSTDLGICYYYTNQPDRALEQFDYSLRLDPKHAKTLLNQGVVRAFGKQDLQGAAASWQKVVDLAPDSREGQAAKRALDGLKSAHPGMGSTTPGGE